MGRDQRYGMKRQVSLFSFPVAESICLPSCKSNYCLRVNGLQSKNQTHKCCNPSPVKGCKSLSQCNSDVKYHIKLSSFRGLNEFGESWFALLLFSVTNAFTTGNGPALRELFQEDHQQELFKECRTPISLHESRHHILAVASCSAIKVALEKNTMKNPKQMQSPARQRTITQDWNQSSTGNWVDRKDTGRPDPMTRKNCFRTSAWVQRTKGHAKNTDWLFLGHTAAGTHYKLDRIWVRVPWWFIHMLLISSLLLQDFNLSFFPSFPFMFFLFKGCICWQIYVNHYSVQ